MTPNNFTGNSCKILIHVKYQSRSFSMRKGFIADAHNINNFAVIKLPPFQTTDSSGNPSTVTKRYVIFNNIFGALSERFNQNIYSLFLRRQKGKRRKMVHIPLRPSLALASARMSETFQLNLVIEIGRRRRGGRRPAGREGLHTEGGAN